MYVPACNCIEREITRELFLYNNNKRSLAHTTNYLLYKCIIHGHSSHSVISPLVDLDDVSLNAQNNFKGNTQFLIQSSRYVSMCVIERRFNILVGFFIQSIIRSPVNYLHVNEIKMILIVYMYRNGTLVYLSFCECGLFVVS